MGRNPNFAVSLDPGEVGARLAHLNSGDQAELFEAFNVELRKVCITGYSAGLQMRMIQDDLSSQAVELFQHMVPSGDT